MQADILDGGPNDCQATGLRCEHVDLVSPLPHIAKQTLNRIGRLNMPMHGGRELVKREGVLFVLRQTSHRFWIALAVLGFEGCQLGQSLLLCRLAPDPAKFGLHLASLAPGNGIKDIALLMH